MISPKKSTNCVPNLMRPWIIAYFNLTQIDKLTAQNMGTFRERFASICKP